MNKVKKEPRTFDIQRTPDGSRHFKRKIKVITPGRRDLDDYFRQSGIRETKKLNHTPFLVFVQEDDNTVRIDIVKNVKDLLKYPPTTRVMAQWTGMTRSDFFRFDVYELICHIRKFPKQDHQEA